MDERHADGLDPKLPRKEKEELVMLSLCTLGTIGQWESNYEKGGSRTAPRKEWSDVELAQQRLLFKIIRLCRLCCSRSKNYCIFS